MTLAAPEAPWTVKAAALRMVVFAVTEIVMTLGRGGAERPDSFLGRLWPLRELLSLSVSLLWAWLLARLNGMAYWFMLIPTGLGTVVVVVGIVLALFGVFDSPLLTRGDPVGWLWIVLLFALLALLVAKPSRRAPWGTMKGF